MKKQKINQSKTNNQSWLNASVAYFKDFYDMWRPLEPMTVSQWADTERRLSSEATSEWGRWDTSKAEYQREIMDSISDPSVERVVIMSSAQVGKTEFILNTMGFFASREPSPMMIVQPTVAMAQTFSKQRVSTMIRDTPILEARFAKMATRRSNNTVLEKMFVGGILVITGANSPTGLRSRPVRLLLLDEVDGYPVSAGKEGDPVLLAEARTSNYYNRKIVLVSTPTVKRESRIEKAYNSSSMAVWEKQCPHCGAWQQLLWGDIRYNTTADKKKCDGEPLGMCRTCGGVADEYAWKRSPGRWYHRQQSAIKGFHLNSLVSPWSSWESIVNQWLDAQGDPEHLQVFVNTKLGEVWEIPGDTVEEHAVTRLREPYNAQVPRNVLVLVMGVDVQDDRLEYVVVGYGVGKESWGIERGKIWGDPRQTFDKTLDTGDVVQCVWTQLDMIRQKDFKKEDGTTIRILRTCVDSGGHATTAVYQYAKRREPNVFAIKGMGGVGKGILYANSKTRKEGATLHILGVDTIKDTLFSRFKIEVPSAGYCHFPNNEDTGFDEEFFAQLVNEKRVRVKDKKGYATYQYQIISSGIGNEALDCCGYALAAVEMLNPPFVELAKRAHLPSASTVIDRTRNVLPDKSAAPKPQKRQGRNSRLASSSMNLEV